MKELPLISVIIPVYNVDSYLDRCISSVVSQSYKKLEIILIDDGSSDLSGEICDKWALRDSRICVIHQKNSGAGAARNAGLDAACGDYIAFIDSDDYISHDMYEHLLEIIGEADIAECAYLKVECDNDNAAFADGHSTSTLFTEEAMREHINNTRFCQVIYNKLYRRETVGKIRFPVGMMIDDEFFTYRVLGEAEKLISSDKVCYAYRQQPDSVMHSMPIEKRVQAVAAKSERLEYLKERFPSLVALGTVDLYFTCIYQGQLALRNLDGDKAGEIISYIKQVMSTFPCKIFGNTPKQMIWLTLAKINLRLTCKLRNALKIGL